MHEFDSDFYGHDMQAVVLGYIRPELNYTTQGVLCSSSHAATRLIIPTRGTYRGHRDGQTGSSQVARKTGVREVPVGLCLRPYTATQVLIPCNSYVVLGSNAAVD